MAKRTKKSPTLAKGEGTTKRLGMNTKAVTRQPTQLHLSTQYPPRCEDSKSKNNKGLNISATPSQHEERPTIATEPAPDHLPMSRESAHEPSNSEAEKTSIQTLKDTISTLRKEVINLSYKIVRPEHHRKFALRCGENKVILVELDYTKKNINVMKVLKTLVTEEEWVERQRADEESIDSPTNKLDKFSDKLANRQARKQEKLQNPGAESNPPCDKHIKRTHNESNKGKKPNNARKGIKQRSPSGCRNNRRRTEGSTT